MKLVKDSKKKVQASIQGDVVRIMPAKIAIHCRRSSRCCATHDFGIDMQFTNYRSS